MTAQTGHGARSAAIFFIALGMFGLYVIELGLVGILPSIIERYGLTIVEAGWLLGTFALTIAVLGPFMVIWLARWDRRVVLVGSLIVFAGCSALSAYAPTYPLLLAIRTPAALLQAVFFSVAFTTARSLYEPERAAHAISMVFVGTSIGLVFGVPITALVEARISYEAAFHFSAITNAVAAIGIWFMLPPSPALGAGACEPAKSFAVLAQPAVVLALLQVIVTFGAMFCLYSFAAEYLRSESGLDGEGASALLLVFGVGGVLGNLVAGRLLGRNLLATVLLHPVALALSYLALILAGGSGSVVLGVVCLLWGAAHTAGMVIGQVWATASTDDAPAFVTSLFVSAGNVGVMAGSSVGGMLIDRVGLFGAIYGGWVFSAMSVALVLAALPLRRRSRAPITQAAH
jgi:DHA1 family inner membrane transport protein